MGLDQWVVRVEGEGQEEEVAYFRKVNFLHRWACEHLNDGDEINCRKVEMPLEKVLDLARLCTEVLADHDLAPKLLPTQSGFFFGGTDYDEYYFSDVQAVLDACKTVMRRELNDRATGAKAIYAYTAWW